MTTTAVGERGRLDPVVLGILLYFAAHTLIRVVGVPNFGVDDTEAEVRTQIFSLYYNARNPPLFDWLFYGAQQLFGSTNTTIHLLKAVLYSGAGILLYYGIRPFFRHRSALYAAILGYPSTIFFGWFTFQQFSHTAAFFLAIGLVVYAYMRVLKHGNAGAYVLLGVALGLGFMSKYLFAILFVALFVSGLMRPAYRARLLSAKMLVVLPVALLILVPFAIGFWLNIDETGATLRHRIVGSASSVAESLFWLAALSAFYWLPLVALLGAAHLRWRGRSAPTATEHSEGVVGPGDPDFYPWMRDATLIMIATMVFAVTVLGTEIGSGGERYLVGALPLLPVAIFAWVDRRPAFPADAVRRFLRFAMVFIIGTAAVRILFFVLAAPPVCMPRCMVFVDYGNVLQQLTPLPGETGVVLTDHVHIGSNLRQYLPDTFVRVGSYNRRDVFGLPAPEVRSCHLVWFERFRKDRPSTAEEALSSVLGRPATAQDMAAVGTPETVTLGWWTRLLEARDPPPLLGVAKVDPASPICGDPQPGG
ncbi:ArnT family glycosyltransferase [Prosthecomicrobium pneumaticum]|uniref:Glycosyltransferase RgtA/B/C/D-like domain-containing protein n=1 Tax=Prosthecomicrobium pneumaticum TaxID=81895 RepID=A0A7W9CT72_9HYPH|nr:glycosyltransferase family 39 protein [Prosthecomicrobium pneumaticum]MBB5751086.1 hypothetical protein [Prosthecomicrobium pneumaticum]